MYILKVKNNISPSASNLFFLKNRNGWSKAQRQTKRCVWKSQVFHWSVSHSSSIASQPLKREGEKEVKRKGYRNRGLFFLHERFDERNQIPRTLSKANEEYKGFTFCLSLVPEQLANLTHLCSNCVALEVFLLSSFKSPSSTFYFLIL